MGNPTTKPTRPGRTPLLNAQTQERIVNAVRAGSYLDDAAALAGIGRATLFQWLGHGKDAQQKALNGDKLTDRERLYLDFTDAVETARAEAQLRNIAIIQKAANEGTWQAAAWFLERTNPRKWGRHETVEVGIVEDQQVREVSEIALLLDQRIARMRERALGAIETTAQDDAQEPPSLQIAQ
jgi:hypothetical protein